MPVTHSKKCRDKTAKGNVFRTLSFAKKQAKRMVLQTGLFVAAYKCHRCGLFHIGKQIPLNKPQPK